MKYITTFLYSSGASSSIKKTLFEKKLSLESIRYKVMEANSISENLRSSLPGLQKKNFFNNLLNLWESFFTRSSSMRRETPCLKKY